MSEQGQKRGLVVNHNEKVRVTLRGTGEVVETELWDLLATYGLRCRGIESPFVGGNIEFVDRDAETGRSRFALFNPPTLDAT